jgi:hypothetical protein
MLVFGHCDGHIRPRSRELGLGKNHDGVASLDTMMLLIASGMVP